MNTKRMSLAAICAAGAITLGSGGPALAAPPAPSPEPGGLIRIDLAPGEWWACAGYSPQPPFQLLGPNFGWTYTLGPDPIYLRGTPNSPVFLQCTGSGAPFVTYGPLVQTGP